jgi:uncharacterized protein YggT (Ycf19 family)
MIVSAAQVLSVVLEVLLWLILGRYALKLISFGKATFISDLFRRGTDPWFAVVRRITPARVGDNHIPILGVLLVVNLKLVLALLIDRSL